MFDENIQMDKGIDPAGAEHAGGAEPANGSKREAEGERASGAECAGSAGSTEPAGAERTGGAGAASSGRADGSRCTEGNERRGTLIASSEAIEDLVLLEQALAMIADEEAELDAETRQRTLLAGIRLLRDRTAVLIRALERLW